MMVLNPADMITFSFGLDSFNRHYALAKSRGASVIVVENEHIALDLDTPEDYDLLRSKYTYRILPKRIAPLVKKEKNHVR